MHRRNELCATLPFGFSFDVDRFVAAYARVGVSAYQFYRNEDRPPSVAEALAVVGRHGVRFDSIHGVFGFHLDPSGPDASHRAHCLRVYEREGELARELGGPMVVVHPSAWTPDRVPLTRAQVEEAGVARWPRLDDWMRRLAEIGERLGVVYLMENQPFNCPLGHDAGELARRVVAVGSPAVRVCLDTGHAHITGDVVVAVREAAPAIAYVHAHDNDGAEDDHRMPGDGTIDWGSVSAALRECGVGAPRMLEVFYDEARVEAMAQGGLGARLAAALALG